MAVVLISSTCVNHPRWEGGKRILLTHDDNEKKIVAIYYELGVKIQNIKKKGMRLTFVVVQCNGKTLDYCPCVTAFSPDFKKIESFVFYLKSMQGIDKFFLAARMNRKKLLNSISSLAKTTVFINGRLVPVKTIKATQAKLAKAKAAKAAAVGFGTDTESESEDDNSFCVTKKRKLASI